MKSLPRDLQPALVRLSATARVILLTGARQAGKSTLLREALGPRFSYRLMDDPAEAEIFRADPSGFLAALGRRAVLDEAHAVPELFLAVKNAVDRDASLRYALSGSANPALMEGARELLPGRSRLLELRPFSVRELAGSPGRGLFDLLVASRLGARPAELAARVHPAPPSVLDRMLVWGGFPEPALSGGIARAAWYAGYVRLYLERDVRGLRAVPDLGVFRRFMRLVAARTAQTLNLSDISRELGISSMTARRYLDHLELTYQIVSLPPYFRNVGKRIVKSPKVHWADPGVANHLTATQDLRLLERLERIGPVFESWGVAEAVKALGHRHPELSAQLHHFRTGSGDEVDLVLECGEKLLPIEFKATRTPTPRMAAGLRRFLDLSPGQAPAGLLVHRGDRVVPLARDILAVPATVYA